MNNKVTAGKYYGFRCYDKDGKPLGWFYTAHQERDYNYTNNPESFHWCKRWRTEQGAKNNFDWYNNNWQFKTKGGYLRIEVMPEALPDPYERQQKWHIANLKAVQTSKAKYDYKNPVWSVRIKKEVREWLDEERYADESGKPESNTEIINRKLLKLLNLERQGY